MVLPLHVLRERTRDVAALGEYMEDYFLLMQLLTRGETIVDTIDVELAGISIREGRNTVTQSDRMAWDQSQVEFVGESLARLDDNNPLLWRLTEELIRVQSMVSRLEEESRGVLNSRSWRWSAPYPAGARAPEPTQRAVSQRRLRLLGERHSTHPKSALGGSLNPRSD